LDVAQLHGGEMPADYPASLPVWKAVRVGEVCDLSRWRDCPAEALLLDGPASGSTFDWRLAVPASKPVILAGGLDASNVAVAVALAHAWGVDACSRIESAPGKKDHRKMNEFLEAAKAALGR
jgi:phosphoribosylanthranilate isomerase